MKSRYTAQKLEGIQPSGIRKFFDLVSGMEDVISLGVGEPDFVTPWHIREGCMFSLEKGYTMYTSNSGLPELREEIVKYIRARNRVSYDPKTEVLVTVGVSEGLDLALRAVLDAGDEVILPQPCYVSYMPCVLFSDGVPVPVCTSASNGFSLTARQVEQAVSKKTKALLLCYPNNPTGASIGEKELGKIAALARKHDFLVISDEIYDRLTYDGRHVSFPSLPFARERTIFLNGFSKAFAMTGWRIGYACAPAEIIEAMTRIHAYTMLCAPITGQTAAVEALKNGEESVEMMVSEYNRRRKLIVSGLNAIGLSCHMPQGAFYVFPSIVKTGMTSERFCEKLLFKEKVAVVPGTAFGPMGDGYIRCSYAASVDDINEALRRIGRFLKRHCRGSIHRARTRA